MGDLQPHQYKAATEMLLPSLDTRTVFNQGEEPLLAPTYTKTTTKNPKPYSIGLETTREFFLPTTHCSSHKLLINTDFKLPGRNV